jgi:hypothetical protein
MGLAIGYTNSGSRQSDCLHLAGDWVAHNDSMRAYQFNDSSRSVGQINAMPVVESVV